MPRNALAGALVGVVAALALGCSSSEDEPPTVTIEVTANQLRFG